MYGYIYMNMFIYIIKGNCNNFSICVPKSSSPLLLNLTSHNDHTRSTCKFTDFIFYSILLLVIAMLRHQYIHVFSTEQ